MLIMAVQEEVLRPYSAVLRGADGAEAREAAVAAVAEAVTVHARRLGSGTAKPFIALEQVWPFK